MNTRLATSGSCPLMVVDDDDGIRETIQTVVEAEGYHVLTATNGQDALNQLRSGPKPCFILLDLRMPVMDGRTFRDLQNRDRELAAIPVVILSGDLDACREAARSGTEFILKPVDLEHLLSIAQRYCPRGRQSIDPYHLVRESKEEDSSTSLR